MNPSERLSAVFALSLLVASASIAWATDAVDSQLTPNAVDQSELEWSGLSSDERVRAQAFALSATEWRRFQSLLLGIRGSVSPATLSPIEVLGIHARDASERRRYAEQWALAMRDDADRILAFQRAYDEAARRLFPDVPLIDADRLARRGEREQALAVTDRLLLFTRADCAACDVILARLLTRLDRVAGIDVYLSGVAAGDEQAIRDWAVARQIPLDAVHNRQVTLNFEADTRQRFAPGRTEVPLVLRRRGAAVTVLPGSAW